MADWFDFKDVRSTDLGVYVTEYPPIPVAEERVEYKVVPGRPGSLAILEGTDVYDDVTLSIACFMHDISQLENIARWLTGTGDLILGNLPERKRIARVSNQIDIVKVMRGRDARIFDVVFRCDPFWYEAQTSPIPLRHATILPGEGTVDADPEITIDGVGDVTLNVGETTLTITGMTSPITIDCARRLAYSGTTSLSHKVAGDWPKLSTESTAINWTGSVSRVIITPNWRWL